MFLIGERNSRNFYVSVQGKVITENPSHCQEIYLTHDCYFLVLVFKVPKSRGQDTGMAYPKGKD